MDFVFILRRTFPGFLCALICALFVLPSSVSAGRAEKAENRYKRVQDDIKTQKEKIEEARKLEGATLGELDRINKEMHKVSEKLRGYKKQLKSTKRSIRKVEAEIADIKVRIEGRKEWMRRKLRAMHRYGKYGDILMLLSASEDFSQLLRRWRYLEVLASYERAAIEEHRRDLKALNDRQERLSSLYARLEDETRRVDKIIRELSKSREKKRQILVSVRRKKSSYGKMLKDLMISSRNLREIIRGSEGTGKFAGKGFRNLKGRLLWPVNGKVAIPYGKTEDPRFKTPVFRNGIYITTPKGSVAKAVHRGEVVFADWFKGYGQLVVLNHGQGYHSLYANLSEIFLKPGDIIESKGDIGKVGELGMLNRSSLYFEIRFKGKALNPTQWLRRNVR
jgi:septal ring factor EnvC (AmiA/AmiB activator)